MYRNNAFYVQPKKTSPGELLLILGMLLLFLAIAVIVLVVWNRRKLTKQQNNLLYLTEELKKHQENMYKAGEDLGIDPADLKAELFESSNLVCYVYPKNNVCDETFYELKDGCCELKSNAKELSEKARRDMAIDMTGLVFMSVLPEVILTYILPNLLKSARGSAFLARVGGAGSAAFSKIMSKVISQAATKMAIKMAATAATMATKLLIKMSAGPVGMVLFMLDIILAVQDYADVYNYNSFLDNKGNMGIRDKLIYEFALTMAHEKVEYPVLFPFAFLFEEEATTAITEYQSKIVSDYIVILVTEIPGGSEFFEEYINTLIEGEEDNEMSEMSQEEDQKTSDLFTAFFEKVREDHHLKLDKFLFDSLQELVPANRKKDVLLIPSMSSAKTFGIGISEEAAERWNNEQREVWFKYLDAFNPPNRPSKDWFPPFSAAYTDTYLVPNLLNPGTSNAPNIITQKLPVKVTLMYPFGLLTTFCEKKRASASYQLPIDPTDHGVKLNQVTGVCDFTRSYCQRYGIDFKTRTWKDGTPYNDCDLSKGQEVAEAIIGTENVRQAKLWFTDPNQAGIIMAMQIFNTFLRRSEQHGPLVALLLAGIDPAGSFEVFGLSIDAQLKGRDKYCDPEDTCKEFKVQHLGGNFMGWSARDKDNQVYSNGQGYQNQVKHGEEHSFFVPEGGYFRIKCDPGDSKNIPYDEITDKMRFSCWWGKVTQDPTDTSFWNSGRDFFDEDAGPAILAGLETAGQATGEFVKDEILAPVGEFFEDVGEFVEDEILAPVGEVGNTIIGGLTDFFTSDRRLKKDVKKTTIVSPIPGLSVYTWNWNEIAMSTYGLKGSDFGFITDEIPDKYISKDVYGYEYIKEGTPISEALIKLKSK